MYTITQFKSEQLSQIGDHDPFKIFFDIKKNNDDMLNFTLYTLMHSYHIKAIEGMDEDSQGKGRKSYLGCVMENRSPYPGETHLRGTDLPDGEFNEETWNRILINILNHELQSIFTTNQSKTVINEE